MKCFKKIALLFLIHFSIAITPAYAVIKVGTVLFEPPFAISPGVGFDADLIKVLCQGMKVECQLIPMTFNKLFGAIDDGTIDLAIGSITVTNYRQNKYIFSMPYSVSRGQFLTLTKRHLNTIDQLKNTTVALIKGEQPYGAFYNYLTATYPGIFQIATYNDLEDIIHALSQEKISAAFLHKSTADYWVLNGGGQFALLGGATFIANGMAIMALPKNKDLIAQINLQLQLIQKNGVYGKLYKTYFSPLE